MNTNTLASCYIPDTRIVGRCNTGIVNTLCEEGFLLGFVTRFWIRLVSIFNMASISLSSRNQAFGSPSITCNTSWRREIRLLHAASVIEHTQVSKRKHKHKHMRPGNNTRSHVECVCGWDVVVFCLIWVCYEYARVPLVCCVFYVSECVCECMSVMCVRWCVVGVAVCVMCVRCAWSVFDMCVVCVCVFVCWCV